VAARLTIAPTDLIMLGRYRRRYDRSNRQSDNCGSFLVQARPDRIDAHGGASVPTELRARQITPRPLPALEMGAAGHC